MAIINPNYNVLQMRLTLMTILSQMKAKGMTTRVILKDATGSTRLGIQIIKNNTGLTTIPVIQRHDLPISDVGNNQQINDMLAETGISNLLRAEDLMANIKSLEAAIMQCVVTPQGQLLPTSQQVFGVPISAGGITVVPILSNNQISFIYEFDPEVSLIVKNDLQY